ncbi:MAG: Zn-dependent hydrolase [Roseiflexaceae bacterium]
MRELPLDIEQLLSDLESLAERTEPGTPGWTRRAFSPAHAAGRTWLEAEMRAAGLGTTVDAAGNLIGRLPGTHDLPPIAIGSHTDTVMGGGRYDGTLGVLAGLTIVRALNAAKLQLRHPLEIIDFLAEESTPLGSSIGSSAMAGALDPATLQRRDSEGRSLAQVLAASGGRPEDLAQAARPSGSLAAYLELHIEQGPLLEQRGTPLGIVDGIVGIRRATLRLTGRPDHAGTTPMPLRHDALAAAAEIVLAVERAAQLHGDAVATVGMLLTQPNQANVVPGQVTFSVEVRSLTWQTIEYVWEEVIQAIEIACAARGVTATTSDFEDIAPIRSPAWLIATLDAACATVAPGAPHLSSGAGHDGSWISQIAPVGMIFVRCRDGRSHCPEEYASPEDISLGVAALARALLSLDHQL